MSRAGAPALAGAAALAATALGGGCLSLPYAVGALGVRGPGPLDRCAGRQRGRSESLPATDRRAGTAAAGRWWAASGPWSSRRWRTA